jgi:hypothetical protein
MDSICLLLMIQVYEYNKQQGNITIIFYANYLKCFLLYAEVRGFINSN